jgi:hypothetical protein
MVRMGPDKFEDEITGFILSYTRSTDGEIMYRIQWFDGIKSNEHIEHVYRISHKEE